MKRKNTGKLSIYLTNINGLNSKKDSLTQIIQNISPDIIVICELKIQSTPPTRNFFKKLCYDAKICQESGVLIATKMNIPCINVTTTTHKNILSAKVVVKNVPLRVIAAYGLQETRSSEDRTEFFDELSIEIENSILHEDNPIIIGDLNAKLTHNNNSIDHLSPNGRLLAEIINEHSLNVLNFHPKCQGKWTRSITKKGVCEESVLDYVITNNKVISMVKDIVIDEERTMTPFTLGTGNRHTSTDHNAILTNLLWSAPEKTDNRKENQPQAPDPGWKITSEGLGEFYKMTNVDNSYITCQTYDQLEEHIFDSMNNCFEKRRKPKHVIYEKVRTNKLVKVIDQLKPMMKQGRVEKIVAKEYIDIIKDIELKKSTEKEIYQNQ